MKVSLKDMAEYKLFQWIHNHRGRLNVWKRARFYVRLLHETRENR